MFHMFNIHGQRGGGGGGGAAGKNICYHVAAYRFPYTLIYSFWVGGGGEGGLEVNN